MDVIDDQVDVRQDAVGVVRGVGDGVPEAYPGFLVEVAFEGTLPGCQVLVDLGDGLVEPGFLFVGHVGDRVEVFGGDFRWDQAGYLGGAGVVDGGLALFQGVSGDVQCFIDILGPGSPSVVSAGYLGGPSVRVGLDIDSAKAVSLDQENLLGGLGEFFLFLGGMAGLVVYDPALASWMRSWTYPRSWASSMFCEQPRQSQAMNLRPVGSFAGRVKVRAGWSLPSHRWQPATTMSGIDPQSSQCRALSGRG